MKCINFLVGCGILLTTAPAAQGAFQIRRCLPKPLGWLTKASGSGARPIAAPVTAASFIEPALLRAQAQPTRLKLARLEMARDMLVDDLEMGIPYFRTEAEREAHRIYAYQGRLYRSNGEVLHAMEGETIFVMDAQGRIYAGRTSEVSHHSSFLAGRPVTAAGSLQVDRGIVQKIDNSSGHYVPTRPFLLQARDRLREMGIELPDDRVFMHGAVHPLGIIDPRLFSDSRSFSRNIHTIDPETEWVKAIGIAFKKGNAETRALAISHLDSKVPESPQVRALVRDAIQDRNERVRLKAVKIAARRHRDGAWPGYFEELRSVLMDPKTPLVMREAATESFTRGDPRPEVVALVLELARSNSLVGSPGGLANLWQALGKRRDPVVGDSISEIRQRFLKGLIELNQGRNPKLRDEARWKLQYLRSVTMPGDDGFEDLQGLEFR